MITFLSSRIRHMLPRSHARGASVGGDREDETVRAGRWQSRIQNTDVKERPLREEKTQKT